MPLCGSSVEPNQCGTVVPVLRAAAPANPPTVVVMAWRVESSMTWMGDGEAATLTEAATRAPAAAARATTGNRIGRDDISHTLLSFTPADCTPALRRI